MKEYMTESTKIAQFKELVLDINKERYMYM